MRLLIALYLSLHEHLLLNLGNQSETFTRFADAIEVNRNTLKNHRDWFDRHVENHRRGWDKALSEEMKRLLDQYANESEQSLRGLVEGFI
jgi:hypothetical protein